MSNNCPINFNLWFCGSSTECEFACLEIPRENRSGAAGGGSFLTGQHTSEALSRGSSRRKHLFLLLRIISWLQWHFFQILRNLEHFEERFCTKCCSFRSGTPGQEKLEHLEYAGWDRFEGDGIREFLQSLNRSWEAAVAHGVPRDSSALPRAEWNWEIHHSTISHLTGSPDVSAECIITAVQMTQLVV